MEKLVADYMGCVTESLDLIERKIGHRDIMKAAAEGRLPVPANSQTASSTRCTGSDAWLNIPTMMSILILLRPMVMSGSMLDDYGRTPNNIPKNSLNAKSEPPSRQRWRWVWRRA